MTNNIDQISANIDKLRHVARGLVDVHDKLEQSGHYPFGSPERKYIMGSSDLLHALADTFDAALAQQGAGEPVEQPHGGNLDEATAKAILAFVNRPGDTYNGYVRRQLGLGFALALKRAIDRTQMPPAPQPAADAGQAVAWTRKRFGEDREFCEKPFTTDWQPLYAAPVSPRQDAGQAEPVDYLNAILTEVGQSLFDMQSVGTWLRVADAVRRVAAPPAPQMALTDEQIAEIAEGYWLKDAQKEGEFFDSVSFTRAIASRLGRADMSISAKSIDTSNQPVDAMNIGRAGGEDADMLWDAGDPELPPSTTAEDFAADFAGQHLIAGDEALVTVLRAKSMPDRKMLIKLPKDDEAEGRVHWEWVDAIASETGDGK